MTADRSTTGALQPEQDAYGQLYLAVQEGREAFEIMERDDGLIYAGDPSDYFHPYRRWPAVEKRAMRWVRGRVLDIGSGAGRVSLHLQERGHDVLAIDESPLAIEVARRRGVHDARVLSLTAIEPDAGPFDTVLLLRNNFGLAGPEDSAGPLLERLANLTNVQGRIITDSVDPERLDDYDFRVYSPSGAPGARPAAQRYRVRWRHYATPWFYYLMLASADLERLLAGSPWRVRRFIDDGSLRYAAVLEKRL